MQKNGGKQENRTLYSIKEKNLLQLNSLISKKFLVEKINIDINIIILYRNKPFLTDLEIILGLIYHINWIYLEFDQHFHLLMK